MRSEQSCLEVKWGQAESATPNQSRLLASIQSNKCIFCCVRGSLKKNFWNNMQKTALGRKLLFGSHHEITNSAEHSLQHLSLPWVSHRKRGEPLGYGTPAATLLVGVTGLREQAQKHVLGQEELSLGCCFPVTASWCLGCLKTPALSSGLRRFSHLPQRGGTRGGESPDLGFRQLWAHAPVLPHLCKGSLTASPPCSLALSCLNGNNEPHISEFFSEMMKRWHEKPHEVQH